MSPTGRETNGWANFAALMLVLIGTFNIFEGLVALFSPARLFVAGEELVIMDFDRWGWIMLVWGAVMILAGAALSAGATWARVFAVPVALVNALGQLTWLGVQPWLSVLMIGLDIAVVWGLTVGWSDVEQPGVTI